MNDVRRAQSTQVALMQPAKDELKPALTGTVRATAGILAILLAIGASYLATSMCLAPPARSGANGLSQFSSAEALRDLNEIARMPHPLGSSEQERVRQVLLSKLHALGIEAQTLDSTVVGKAEQPPLVMARVHNVVARIPGRANTKALLLVAHYDSVPGAPGAGDNGAAIASLIEVLRTLQHAAALRNDIVVLFSDGEEVGLLGAKAFVESPTWENKIGLVLNFDARGGGGPLLMFETSRGNGWLIDEVKQSGALPVAHAAMGSIYRVLPYGTDFTVFRGANLPGLNFAFIDKPQIYHSPLDRADNMEQATVEEEGNAMLRLALQFGNEDLSETPRQNDVTYFNLLGRGLVRYGRAGYIGSIVLALAALLTAAVFVVRWHQGSAMSFFIGFLSVLLAGFIAFLVTFGLSMIIVRDSPVRSFMTRYHIGLYDLGFLLGDIACLLAVYGLARRRYPAAGLALGASTWWLLFMVAAILFLPGTVSVFAWPVVLSSAAVLLLGKSSKRLSPFWIAAIAAVCAISCGLLAPLFYLILSAAGFSLGRLVLLILVFFFGLMYPLFELASLRSRWILPGATLLGAIIITGWASFMSLRSPSQPQPDHLFYAMDASTQTAVWASQDAAADSYTGHFLTENAKPLALGTWAQQTAHTYRSVSAPLAAITPPSAVLVDEATRDGERHLTLRISSPRQAQILAIAIAARNVQEIEVDGKKLPVSSAFSVNGDWTLRYYGFPREGILISVSVAARTPFTLKAVDESYGLPQTANIQPPSRPADFMPLNSIHSDTTLVGKSFSF